MTDTPPELTDAQLKALAALREPFGPEHTGVLPKPYCKACNKAPGRCCDDHKKAKCARCGQYMTEAHIDLDYVGHGAVTDRCLEVDLTWNWDPVAKDERGLPVFEYDGPNPVGLWINLTVAGVTRLGYGSCAANQGDAVKVLIGDALRNAAMRFGVALDLWIKGHAEDSEQRTVTAAGGRKHASRVATITEAEAASFAATINEGGKPARKAWIDEFGVAPAELPAAKLDAAIAWVARNVPRERGADGPPAEAPGGNGNGHRPPAEARPVPARGLRKQDIAALASEVFAADGEAAAPRTKTRVIERLRRAATYAATGGRVSSLTQAHPTDLPVVWAFLNAISTGAITYRHDAADDNAGATFTGPEGEATVLWSELEAPDAAPAAR